MSRTTFAALLHKYQTGAATPSERQVVEQWYALLKEEPRPLSEREWKSLENRLWAALKQKAMGKATPDEAKVVPLWQRSVFKLSIAASVCLLAVFGYGIYKLSQSEGLPVGEILSKTESGLKVVRNTTVEDLAVALEDGSKVLLKPESELRFTEPFADSERTVSLDGEAFFEVSENPDRPFLVNTGEITTKVLGTSFSVRARPDDSIVEVAVKTGKVSVYERTPEKSVSSSKKGNGVVIGPNHQVVFTKNEKLFLTGLVDDPEPVPKQASEVKPTLDFDDVPLREVLGRLETTYNIDIETDKHTLGECPLTARLSGKGLYAQLEIICAVIQGTYEVKGTTILISGKGCEF